MMYVVAFIIGLVQSYVLANVFNFAGASTIGAGAMVGFMCWLGFVGATSYTNQVTFSGKPLQLWAIDSGYNLVCFVITGAMFGVWR